MHVKMLVGVHAPAIPAKLCLESGVAVSVTVVPFRKVATHPDTAATPLVIVQLIPPGLDVTTPLPNSPPVTVSV